MKHLRITLLTLGISAVAAASIAQTQEPPAPDTVRRQSGRVGPPLDAASMNAPAASAVVTPAAPGPAPAAEASAEQVAPREPSSPPPSRRASGRVTEASESAGALPIRPDRN